MARRGPLVVILPESDGEFPEAAPQEVDPREDAQADQAFEDLLGIEVGLGIRELKYEGVGLHERSMGSGRWV